MHLQTWFRPLLATLATLGLGAAAAVDAGQLAADVAVKVRLITSSGVCGVLDRPERLGVSCGPSGGPLVPQPGSVPYQRVGTIQAPGVVPQPLALYSDGVKISSWRIVRLDNAEYLELTVAW